MNLADLAKASSSLQTNHSILIYGPPKSGKTELAGTAAKIPAIKRVFFFDLENGAETLLRMGLTNEELAKVTLYKIPDIRDNPVGIETVLRAFSSRTPISICHAHGKVDCPSATCKVAGAFDIFCLTQCGHNDLVIVDSGSQLGDSALNATMKGKPFEYKAGWDEFNLSGKWLSDILMTAQQAQYTNFVFLTHEIAIEEDLNGVKRDKIYPLMGSKNFCMKVAKYFGTVVYTHIKMNKHTAGSSSTYKSDTITGSRLNVKTETSSNPTMHDILVMGGVLK